MDLWIGALNLGLLYAFMATGVFITFRIHDFPDITVDGTFVTGAAVSAVLIVAGVNPLLALGLSFIAGACAGAITAFIHTRFNINGLLAGILVMTGLYSVNLHIMGKSNIPLLNGPGIIDYLQRVNPGMIEEVWFCVSFFAIVCLFWVLVSLFFKTDLGITMRATGNNPTMAGASGVNVALIKGIGIALSNGLVAVSGSLVAQYQGFADVGMGIGSVVFGLAAVIIGESVLRTRSIYGKVLSVIIGSIVFRLMVALALYGGLNPIDLKLVTALFVLAILVGPKLLRFRSPGGKDGQKKGVRRAIRLRIAVVGLSCCLLAVMVFGAYRLFIQSSPAHQKKVRIGVVQLTENGILDITRDAFLQEMKRLGYSKESGAILDVKSANGDMATVSSVLDKFVLDKADVVLTISTGCTQAAINRIKDRPVVFATVANPFLVGAGKSDTDHLPNVTGVYGPAPVGKLLDMASGVLPAKAKIGCIWDPSQQNGVYNVNQLKAEVSKRQGLTFVGATVSASPEVYEAATSLASRGIDAFVLPPDNIVFAAFDSVVKAARARKIPVFVNDVELLRDGALGVCGYDYASSGVQAARLVDRILKGEKPASIPFEKYEKITVGFNKEVAKELGIAVSDQPSGQAAAREERGEGREKNLALFSFSDSVILKATTDGVEEELRRSGTLRKYSIRIDLKNAHNDYGVAQAIVQDMVRRQYDYIITASTLALQVTANGNKTIPHVFGAVTDPYRMGVARSAGDHIPNITGVATFQPVESTIKAMRSLFPAARRIGIVWNPSEANSEACTLKARATAKAQGFELLERTVASTDEVKDAVTALVSKGIDVFFISGDNTMILALPTAAQVLSAHNVPLFTNDPTDAQRGALFSIGADYFQVGVEIARMAERVIAGEKTNTIPIREYVPEKIGVNLGLAKLFGVTIPDSIVKKAGVVKR